jgi:tetratricopeptide (TPR) repeat protein
MRSIMMGLVILGCLSSVSTGFADNVAKQRYKFAKPKDQKAIEHQILGLRLYNIQDFKGAIEEFKAGALVEPCSCFDYNLGQSYRLTGQYKQALWHYQRFLNNGKPTGEVLEAVQKWIAEMEAQVADAARTMPPTEAASIAEPEPSAPSIAARVAANRTQGTAQRDAASRNMTLESERSASTPVNWIGWTTTAGGVAALGASGYLFLRASSLDDQGNKTPDTRARHEFYDQSNTRRLAGAIIGAGGLALTATGLYLLITQSGHRGRATAAAVNVGITGDSVVVLGRF